MAKEKASAALFDQLQTAIEGGEGEEIVGKVKVCSLSVIEPTPNYHCVRNATLSSHLLSLSFQYSSTILHQLP